MKILFAFPEGDRDLPSPRMRSSRRQRTMFCALLVLFAAATAATDVQAQANACGAIRSSYGPFDYRTTRGDELRVVEEYHFTPTVEALLGGKSGNIGGDLDYTLHVFPNHHRALMSLLRYSEKYKLSKDPDMKLPFECYFERAVRFRQDDPIARMLYASFLGKQNRISAAQQQLKAAEAVADGNPFTYYNVGMIYADLKDWDNALVQAHKAYALGFPQPGLRERIKSAGKWRDPQ